MKKSLVASTVLALALTGAGATAYAVNADAATPSHSVQSQQVARAKKLTVSMFAFSPATLKVHPGQKIKIVNMDAVAHTWTSDDGSSFDVPLPAKTTVVAHAPMTPGKYAYHCTIHPSMHGTLVVKKS